MNKEYELFTRLTTFILEHKIECEEDIYQTDSVAEDSLELFEDLFDIVKSKNNNEHSAITNADRIRAMTDEELANFLDIISKAGILSQYTVPCNCCLKDKTTECDNCWKEWLKLEAE